MTYGCKCNCESFREHVGFGPMVRQEAMPTRKNLGRSNAQEKQWEKDADAYKRLDQEGYQLKSLNGAAEIEARATQKIELEHGRLYGERAKTMQKVADGETA